MLPGVTRGVGQHDEQADAVGTYPLIHFRTHRVIYVGRAGRAGLWLHSFESRPPERYFMTSDLLNTAGSNPAEVFALLRAAQISRAECAKRRFTV